MAAMEGKPWYASKGVWGSLVAIVATISPIVASMGKEGVTDDVTRIAAGVVAVIAAMISLWGRYKAVKPIK
jgi:uncharacterized membrane protein